MDSKPELRQMASEGKDKLEWSRTVDAEKLEQLKEMMASPDYKVPFSSQPRSKFWPWKFCTFALSFG